MRSSYFNLEYVGNFTKKPAAKCAEKAERSRKNGTRVSDKKSDIIEKNNNSSNSYQHFQQAFPHLVFVDAAGFLTKTGKKCLARKCGLVTKN